MEVQIGKVTHYFNRIGVAAIELSDSLETGNFIHIKGRTTDIEQKVEAIQIDNRPITRAGKGQVIGLKVKDYVREHDVVYKIES